MALQFILGASGTGKTKYLYEQVIRSAKEREKDTFYFIVPEQFTLQTQKELVEYHPDGGIFNIDVLSMARLAHKVFAELAKEQRKILKDTGKSMVVKKALNECRAELELFGSNAGQAGFTEEMKSLFSELLQYGVNAEKLEKLKEEQRENELLYKKLQDVTMVYRKFEELMGERYMTSEGLYDALADCIEESSVLKNCEIVLEGFTGFTPSQDALLKKFMTGAKKVSVSLTWEEENGEMFSMSRKTIQKLKNLAQEVQCEVLPDIRMGSRDLRHSEKSDLEFLRSRLFRYPVRKKEGTAGEEITLFAGQDAGAECRFAVTKIQELLQEKEYRYRDIAVIVSDMEQYGEKMAQELSRASIPCFLDYKKTMSENTFAEYLKALLQLTQTGLTTEGILSYVKNSLSGFEKEQVCDLENYCFALGIKGYQFEREWKKTYRTRTEIPLEALNRMRERILKELCPLLEVFRKKDRTVAEWTETLFYFLQEHKIEQKLGELEEKFREAGDWLRVREYAQVYSVVLDLFDQLVELLGEQVMTPGEYRELVETGLREAKVGLIPAGAEQILIGDMERTRLREIKALFFLGVNEGKVPSAGEDQGILSEKDREILSSETLELTPDAITRRNQEQFYLYLNLTKPSERLYLTYACLNEEGKTVRTSYLIGKIRALFRDLSVQTSYTTKAESLVQNDIGKTAFLNGLRAFAQEEAEEEFAELYRFYERRMDKEKMKALIAAAIYEPKEEKLEEETAHRLYGELVSGSVTRMELYSRCAFAHFLEHGLKLEERMEYEVSAPDIGNLYHDGLRRFGEVLLAQGKKWQQISVEERNELAERCAKEAVEAYSSDVFLSSARNHYLTEQMLRVLKKTVNVMAVQLAESDFSPVALEQEFLHTDRSLKLRGIIDRVDVSEENGREYIKIVDYKSGNRDFSLEELYYGLSMQLAVYMAAVLREKSEAAVPAGMFYYHLDDPFVDKTGDVDEKVLRKLCVKGLVNKDMEVIRRLDHEFKTEAGGLAESVKSYRIPVETGKNGELKKSSKVVEREQFDKITDFVYEKLQEETKEILSGAAAIAPYKLRKKTGCDYCAYASVCGFDKKNGDRYRVLEPLSEEEVFLALCRSTGNGE